MHQLNPNNGIKLRKIRQKSIDRVIGLVYCGGNDKLQLNEHLLEEGNHAHIFVGFCGRSECFDEDGFRNMSFNKIPVDC